MPAIRSTLYLFIAISRGASASDGPALSSSLPVRVHPDVRAAIDAGRPVVALESTIISHGMPYPENVRTAREVEAVVAAEGALPATIAVLDGVCCVGLTDAELERFAQLGSAGKVRKVSRRDLAHAVAVGAHGGTTVSSTMLLSHMCDIPIFVTGGIGGVHRGGEDSLDVSADLCELGRTPVAVVSAGIKSILDIPRTLEYLETQGVAVLALDTDEFPAFFTRSSGCRAPSRVDGVGEAARVIAASQRLGLGSGMLIGVPIPTETEAEASLVQGAIAQALGEADARGIGGRDVTPFLLARVAELTDGASLAANIALIKNNAATGAQIACELAKHRRQTPSGSGAAAAGSAAPGAAAPGAAAADAAALGAAASDGRAIGSDDSELPMTTGEGGGEGGGAAPPVVVGACVADLVASPAAGTPLLPGTSSPGVLEVCVCAPPSPHDLAYSPFA